MFSSDTPGVNRRHFLKHLAGLSALAVPGLQFYQGLRAAESQLKKENKSLIILWMGGGPSHMDLWDLKPGQPTGGEFKPIKTSADGIEIGELLPTVAKEMKHLSIVRSLVTREGSHERGTTLMNTGRMPNPVVQYPALGATTSSLLTPKELALPGFIGIGGTAQRIGPGFLGSVYAPFTIQNAGQPPENIAAPSMLGQGTEADQRQLRRQRLFNALEDRFGNELYPHLKVTREQLASRDAKVREAAQKRLEERKQLGDGAQSHAEIYQKGFDLTISNLKTVFEVRNESAKVLEAYGGLQNGFGMGCLLARKLVEKGVSCVEVDLGGWDNHANIFTTLRGATNRMGNGPRLDQGMGALVNDLVDRGLWKNTVVLWMGEFGRTPRINANAGRDHWATCWSVVLGGGAIKGGQVYGATSENGMEVAKDPCSVGDLFATVFKGLGLDPQTKVRDNLGRPGPIAYHGPDRDAKPLAGLV
jgi:hypothetical protein